MMGARAAGLTGMDDLGALARAGFGNKLGVGGGGGRMQGHVIEIACNRNLNMFIFAFFLRKNNSEKNMFQFINLSFL